RVMSHCRWVYCTEASKVRLGIEDDDDTTYGSYHGGTGWELLTVERTIAGDNATTLSAVVTIASTDNASTIYLSRGWFYFGTPERVKDGHYLYAARREVRRDDTSQHVYLDEIVPRGYQIRLLGYDPLTGLGTTPSTQVTATM